MIDGGRQRDRAALFRTALPATTTHSLPFQKAIDSSSSAAPSGTEPASTVNVSVTGDAKSSVSLSPPESVAETENASVTSTPSGGGACSTSESTSLTTETSTEEPAGSAPAGMVVVTVEPSSAVVETAVSSVVDVSVDSALVTSTVTPSVAIGVAVGAGAGAGSAPRRR